MLKMKITMYELLGLVKDGKAPKKIKYSSCIMIYDVDENDYRTLEKDYYDADVKTYKYLTDCIDIFTDLNNEIEIIEEPKNIKKIDSILRIDDLIPPYGENEYKAWKNIIIQQNKINELIDEVNKLKEK